MPFFQKTASSSNRPSPSIACTDNIKTNNRDGVSACTTISPVNKTCEPSSFTKKRLTRQRKLRHVTDHELRLDRFESPPQPLPLPELPSTSFNSRRPCPSYLGSQGALMSNDQEGIDGTSCNHWRRPQDINTKKSANYELRLKIPPRSAPVSGVSSPVSPQATCSANRSSTKQSNDRNVERTNQDYCLIASSLVSPRQLGATSSSRSSRRCSRTLSHDLNVERTHQEYCLIASPESTTPINGASCPVSPRGSGAVSSSPSCAANGRSKSSKNSHRKWSHDLNIDERTNQEYCLIPSPKSAPTSGVSTPLPIPQQFNTSRYDKANQEFRVQPLVEFSNLRYLVSHNLQVSSEKTLYSPEQSPVHSPRLQSPRTTLRSPDRFAFSLNYEVVQGNNKDRQQGSGPSTAYPLPLPPGVALSMSFVPSPVHPTMEKSNSSFRKTQWQKGKLIGRGTYGSVYLGTNRETGALCAMKEVDIIPDDPKSIECIKQLEQEIKVLQHLKHPNIVQYYGSEIVDDHLYIYLEYIYPGSIRKYVQEHCVAITESIVRNFTRHTLNGLAYLHGKKTIHRDIKGANLLVDVSGTVKLADFGMAKHLTGMTCELSLKGSPHWMAPEVIKAVMQKDASPELAMAVDIWSLGCTVIEMFTGKPPWGELHGPQPMFKVLNRSPPVPETLSKEGKDFLSCCFRRNPTERPSSMKLLEHPFVCNPIDLHSLGHR